MALINLRSPYFIEHTAGTNVGSADLKIEIPQGSTQYVISKDTTSNAVSYEVSEMIRDFLNPTFDGTLPISSTDIANMTVTAYLTLDFYTSNKKTRAANTAAGNPDTPIGSEQELYTLHGFDGYSEFSEGKNHTIGSGQLMQSATIIYIPENTASFIPVESSNAVSYTAISTSQTGSIVAGGITVNIERICEPIYDIIRILFINKFGAIQEFYFNKRNTIAMNVSQNTYQSKILTANTNYSITAHQKYVYNKQAKETITLNTGYIDEGQFETIKQLMLSEQVWGQIGGTTYPINVVTNSLTKKTKVNDKLVNYTLDFEFAFDVINSVR
jgi:hypothetical protein|tara:strand:+ start:6214 stop:7197 length:984 start_codon:yes stop_codon:yes gene_type:complete